MRKITLEGDFMVLPRYITDIRKIQEIPEEKREKLTKITNKFVFRLNDYYLSLIDWNDPNDPIYKLIIPSEAELDEYGKWDASDEYTNYVVPGCQHKYQTTALLIVSEVCGAYCRFCFRKRLFRNDVHEASLDVAPGVEYIRKNPQINNVLLTGGRLPDPGYTENSGDFREAEGNSPCKNHPLRNQTSLF
ncbi:lysine 2,3-aminomutase [Desmospora sp. 8437]|nr:lysine 2,3-aminomutase [Desmospora sp. 8437]